MIGTVPFLDLSREIEEVRPLLDSVLDDVLASGHFILGDEVAAFEQEFAGYCGVDEAVGVASGTDAITVALLALGVSAGDEVVTAANTCIPTIVGIERAGATPVLADVDAETLTLDAASVERVLTKRTRAIVAVHLYGRCADMQSLGELARSHDLRVVEDAAHAHGATYGNVRAGALGDAAAFSFYPTKNLGAVGDGGAVVTRDVDVAERARRLRTFGTHTDGAAHVHGLNSRLDELQAAVLRAKLTLLDDWNERRRELAGRYSSLLADGGVNFPPVVEGHVFHLFPVRVSRRDEVRAALAERGVHTAVHYERPVHRHPAYTQLAAAGFPVSERACNEVLSLPLYPQLTEAEVECVSDALRAATR